MKKLIVIFCTLVLLLALTGTALATPPTPGSFTVNGYTLDPDEDYEFSQTPNHVKIRGLKAEGTIDYFFGESATFFYTENINFNVKQAKSTQEGWMTITTASGTVDIHFVGQAHFTKLFPPPPEGEVVDQPFTVIGGTGAYERFHGQGTRTGNAGSPFTVVYTGQFHFD